MLAKKPDANSFVFENSEYNTNYKAETQIHNAYDVMIHVLSMSNRWLHKSVVPLALITASALASYAMYAPKTYECTLSTGEIVRTKGFVESLVLVMDTPQSVYISCQKYKAGP